MPKKNGFTPIIVLILVVIIVAVVAYKFGFINGSIPLYPPTPNPVSYSPSPNPDETMNWKSYTTNKNMGIDDSFFKIYPNLTVPTLSFKYPKTWRVTNVEPSLAKSIYKESSISISVRIEKEDPQKPLSKCVSEGPCENYAVIDLRFGVVPNTVETFGSKFWGVGFPIKKNLTDNINRTIVSEAFQENSPYPTGVIFWLTPPAAQPTSGIINYNQLFAHIEFFNYNDPANQTKYSQDTIKEINGVIQTFKFTQ